MEHHASLYVFILPLKKKIFVDSVPSNRSYFKFPKNIYEFSLKKHIDTSFFSLSSAVQIYLIAQCYTLDTIFIIFT
jgi:hypothetical protein